MVKLSNLIETGSKNGYIKQPNSPHTASDETWPQISIHETKDYLLTFANNHFIAQIDAARIVVELNNNQSHI